MTEVYGNNANKLGEETFTKKSSSSPFGSSFKKKTKKYSKDELLRLYEPTDQYFEGFTVYPAVSSAKSLEPVNFTDSFKVDKDAKVNPEFPSTVGRGRGTAGRGRGKGAITAGGSPQSIGRGRGRGGSPLSSPEAFKPAWASTPPKSGGLEDDNLELGEEEDAPMSLESLSANTKLVSNSWKKEAPTITESTTWKGNLRVNTENHELQPAAKIVDDTSTILKDVKMDSLWYYQDKNSQLQGPYPLEKLTLWVQASFFSPDLKVKPSNKDSPLLLLSDVINAAKQNEKASQESDKTEHHEGEGDISFGDAGIKSVLDVISTDDHEDHGSHVHPLHQHIHSPLLAQQFQHTPTPTNQWPGNFQRTPSGGFVPYNYQQPVQHSPFHQPNIEMMFTQTTSPVVVHHVIQQQQQHQLHQMYLMQQLQQQQQQQHVELQRQWQLSQANPVRADQLEDELKQVLNILPRTPQPQPPSTPNQWNNLPQPENSTSPKNTAQTQPAQPQEKPQAVTNAWNTNTVAPEKSEIKKEEEIPHKKGSSPIKKKPEDKPVTVEKQQSVQEQKTKKSKKQEKNQPEKTPVKEPITQERKEPAKPQPPVQPQQKEKSKVEPTPSIVSVPVSSATRVWGNTSVTPQGDLSTILKEQQKESKRIEKEKKKTIIAEQQAQKDNVAWGNAAYIPTRSLLEIQQEEQQKKKMEEEKQQQQALQDKTSYKGKVGAVISGSGVVGNIWGVGALGTSQSTNIKQIQQEEQSKKKEKKDTKQQNNQQQGKKKETKQKESQKQVEKKAPQHKQQEEEEIEEGDDFLWDYEENEQEEKEEPIRAFSTGPTQQQTKFQSQPVPQPASQSQPKASKQKKKKESNKAPAKASSYAAILGPSSLSSGKNDFPALGGSSTSNPSMDELFPALPKSKSTQRTTAQSEAKKPLTQIQQLLIQREKEKRKN
jgi:hypothetical protein